MMTVECVKSKQNLIFKNTVNLLLNNFLSAFLNLLISAFLHEISDFSSVLRDNVPIEVNFRPFD